MPDVNYNKAPEKPIKSPGPAKRDAVQPKRQVGLVELILFLLLAGVVFIFIFGMRQMKAEKELELLAQQKFEQIVPQIELVVKAAKEYQANDPFAALPLSIEEMNLPSNINTEAFLITYSEEGIVTATSTKEFGREGIQVKHDINAGTYEISDPAPNEKPRIPEDWLPE